MTDTIPAEKPESGVNADPGVVDKLIKILVLANN